MSDPTPTPTPPTPAFPAAATAATPVASPTVPAAIPGKPARPRMSAKHLRWVGIGIALMAAGGLFVYGCERSKPQKPPTPAVPAPNPGATPPKPTTPESPKDPPKAADATKPDPNAKPDEKAKPPIPHTDLAQDAKPLREFTTPSGLTVLEFKDGEGVPTLPKALVTTHYVLRVKDGWKKVYSTWEQGEPDTNPLDENMVMGEGMIGMKAGGMRRIIVPAQKGFGKEEKKDEAGNVVIPANSTLVYDVDLVSVKQRVVEKPMAPRANVDDKSPEPNK